MPKKEAKKGEMPKKKAGPLELSEAAFKKELQKLGKEVKGLVDDAKKKYDEADPKAKRAVVAGLAGAAALIAGAITYKKMKK